MQTTPHAARSGARLLVAAAVLLLAAVGDLHGRRAGRRNGRGPTRRKQAILRKPRQRHAVRLIAAENAIGRLVLAGIEADMALPAGPAAAPEYQHRTGGRIGLDPETLPRARGQQRSGQRLAIERRADAVTDE